MLVPFTHSLTPFCLLLFRYLLYLFYSRFPTPTLDGHHFLTRTKIWALKLKTKVNRLWGDGCNLADKCRAMCDLSPIQENGEKNRLRCKYRYQYIRYKSNLRSKAKKNLRPPVNANIDNINIIKKVKNGETVDLPAPIRHTSPSTGRFDLKHIFLILLSQNNDLSRLLIERFQFKF